MSPADASHDEMNNHPGPHPAAAPDPDAARWDAILSGGPLPSEGDPATAGLHGLFSALRRPAAGTGELTGEAAALAAFRSHTARPHGALGRRGLRVATGTLLGSKLTAAAAAGAVGLGGLAAAAAISSRPADNPPPAEHRVTSPARPRDRASAPARPEQTHPAAPVGPNLARACGTYREVVAGGDPAALAAAHRQLIDAAHGADQAARSCPAPTAGHPTAKRPAPPSHPAPSQPTPATTRHHPPGSR